MSTWRIPTPHEVLATLFLLCEAAHLTNFFIHGSAGDRMLDLFMVAFAMTGIASARNYISPRLASVLEERDTIITKELHK